MIGRWGDQDRRRRGLAGVSVAVVVFRFSIFCFNHFASELACGGFGEDFLTGLDLVCARDDALVGARSRDGESSGERFLMTAGIEPGLVAGERLVRPLEAVFC